MTLPPELKKMFKERALKRRQEFRQKNCCRFDENDGLERNRLGDCLTRAKQLIDDYEGVYSDTVEDPSVKSLASGINFWKKEYHDAVTKFEEIENKADIFQLQNYLKTACKYIEEYEKLLKELGELGN